jgi:hypothetical protein
MDFEFDLSDKVEVSEKIVITSAPEPVKVVKVIVPINRIDDLKKNIEVREKIEYILWTNELISNEMLIERFVEEFGFSKILATNIVTIHRPAYLNDKGYYSIFGYNMNPPQFYKDLMRDGYISNRKMAKVFKAGKNATKVRGNMLAPF